MRVSRAATWSASKASSAGLAVLCSGLGSFTLPAVAQNLGTTVTPGLSINQLFTDNRNLSNVDKRAESITTISPQIRISSRSGRVQGSLDYSLNGVIYGRESSASSIQNVLSAALRAELIEQHAFVDATASISRQSISAFGTQGNRPNEINSNSTEVRSLSLSPTLRGRLFGDIAIDAGLTSNLISSADNSASDSVNHNASVNVGDGSGPLGWTVGLNRSVADFDGGRSTTQDRATAQVYYTPDPGLRFFVTGGTESNDVVSTERRANDTWGGGVSWQPSPRTQLSAQGERRFFGNSYSLSFSHRLRRSSVSYTDSRSSTQNTAGAGASLSAYELFFIQFASLEPDPVLRDVLVRNFLQASGLNPNDRLNGGFLSSALTVQRARNLSFAWQGARSSFIASAFATATRRLDTVSEAADDLSTVDVLRQLGWNMSLSHRLTPSSSLVLSVSEQRTPSSGSVAGNGLKAVNLSWVNQIARRANLSVSARHAQATGATEYSENTLSLGLSLSF